MIFLRSYWVCRWWMILWGCQIKNWITNTCFNISVNQMGFPGGASGKVAACQCRRHKRCRFNPWAGKIPWKRAWQPSRIFFFGEPHGQRSLVGYSPQGHKELDNTEVTAYTWTRISNIAWEILILKYVLAVWDSSLTEPSIFLFVNLAILWCQPQTTSSQVVHPMEKACLRMKLLKRKQSQDKMTDSWWYFPNVCILSRLNSFFATGTFW